MTPNQLKITAFEEALSIVTRKFASAEITHHPPGVPAVKKAPEPGAREPRECDINLAVAKMALHCHRIETFLKFQQIVGGSCSPAGVGELVGLMRVELGGSQLVNPNSYPWVYGARKNIEDDSIKDGSSPEAFG